MNDPQQAEYLEEIAELERKLAQLEEAEAAPEVLEEYATELDVLRALLEAARRLQGSLRAAPELGARLAARGFQSDRFSDLYAFVYESALELEEEGPAFAREVRRTDFGERLLEPPS